MPRGRSDAVSVFEAVGPDLLAYFERRVRPREDAADLLADTFTTAWRRIDDLPKGDEHRRRWLFAIAIRTLMNHRRGVTRKVALADKLRALLVSESEPDVSDGVAVRDAVNGLPDTQRELVTLVHWEQFTLAEASALLGINASTARSRYASARQSLRIALLGSVADDASSGAENTTVAPGPPSTKLHKASEARLLQAGGSSSNQH